MDKAVKAFWLSLAMSGVTGALMILSIENTNGFWLLFILCVSFAVATGVFRAKVDSR
jgi:DMSO/TMAO reductase YedYZ heme-binding membrane subunit